MTPPVFIALVFLFILLCLVFIISLIVMAMGTEKADLILPNPFDKEL